MVAVVEVVVVEYKVEVHREMSDMVSVSVGDKVVVVLVYHKEMNVMGKVEVLVVYYVGLDSWATSRVYYFMLDSRTASKVEEFLVLGERYVATTVGEIMGMDLGSAMVEATWDQCGEGYAGQVDDDELLLLPTPM